jgi:roadblock/LC7 domain-containing protein
MGFAKTAGSYTITVTGTSGALTETGQVNLTVQ